MKSCNLYFIRHGKTKANQLSKYCGSTDLSLSDIGISELKELKKVCNYPKGDIYFTTAMKRTNETMKIIYPNVKYSIIEGFREYNFGIFEMKSYEELKLNESYLSWINDDTGEVLCPGGESKKEYKKRIKDTFNDISKDILSKGIENAVFICHGGTIGTILELFYDDSKNFYMWQPRCGEGYKMVITYSEKVNIIDVERIFEV